MGIKMPQQFDVTVVGAGIAGLMLTKKLSELGLKVALVEKEAQMAGGPSTKNEGWLHRGTYHATSISDKDTAIQVARRCIYGHEQIRGYAPEAIEDIDLASYALVKDPERTMEVISRWDEAGVRYTRVPLKELARLESNVRTGEFADVFQVYDLGINTRLLYRKLLAASMRAGIEIFLNAEVVFNSLEEALIEREGEKIPITSRLFVYTAGYGVRDILRSNFGILVPLRYWKSHLTVFPRLTRSSVFCLDPHEAGMMNHGDYSIVGLNEDAMVHESPDFEILEEGKEKVYAAASRLFHNLDGARSLTVACIKTDLADKPAAVRSLGVSVTEPLRGHFVVLPGKMTETPYITDVVAKMVYDRIDDEMIAQRPMDTI